MVKKAQASGKLTAARAKEIGISISSKAKTDIVQSTLGRAGLGQKTIDAAKALAEKWGIVTFDVLGNIATIPETRAIDTSINVGTGRFTESAFKKSIEVLQAKSNPITDFANGVNDVILKPIIEGFNSIFTNRNIADLPEEQQNRVKWIDSRIVELKTKLVPVPPCSYWAEFDIFGHRVSLPNTIQSCAARDAAIEYNRISNSEIAVLTAERENIFRKYVVIAGFEKQVLEQAEKLRQLVQDTQLTASVKTAIGENIQIASALIEEILSKQISISQSSLTALQSIMVTAAHRMQEQVIAGADTAEKLANTLMDSVLGLGGALGDLGGLVEGIVSGIAGAFDKLMNPSLDDLEKRETRWLDLQGSKYARFYEESQKMLAGGK